MKVTAVLLALLSLYSCNSTKRSLASTQPAYTPVDKNLYDTIVKLDSVFFRAYNTCNVNLETYASFFAEDIEFYHDKGGLSKDKKQIVESTKNNVCGKVTRQLVPGTIEVYPIANYGAIEIGYHTFRNSTEPAVDNPHPGRFVIIWRHANNAWQIMRVISLH